MLTSCHAIITRLDLKPIHEMQGAIYWRKLIIIVGRAGPVRYDIETQHKRSFPPGPGIDCARRPCVLFSSYSSSGASAVLDEENVLKHRYSMRSWQK